jgi:hypothetical protein
MKNLLLFSDKLKEQRNILQFHIKKYYKIFMLFLKWNKNIKKIQLSYFREWRFEKSYLIIHFDFKNAVWYQLGNIKRINCLQPIVLNLENINNNKVELIVHGLFRQRKYLIDIAKSETLITDTFKTEINRINLIQEITASLNIKLNNPLLVKQIIRLDQKKVETNTQTITISLNKYTQNEYI